MAAPVSYRVERQCHHKTFSRESMYACSWRRCYAFSKFRALPAAALGSTGSDVSMMKRTGATMRKSVVELYQAALRGTRRTQVPEICRERISHEKQPGRKAAT
jgi:hypothetical protein